MKPGLSIGLAALLVALIVVGMNMQSTAKPKPTEEQKIVKGQVASPGALGAKVARADGFSPTSVAPSFPAIKDVVTVNVDNVDNNLLADNDLVIGVEFNGETRAYPINMLCGPTREIINDQLGGQPIAATW